MEMLSKEMDRWSKEVEIRFMEIDTKFLVMVIHTLGTAPQRMVQKIQSWEPATLLLVQTKWLEETE